MIAAHLTSTGARYAFSRVGDDPLPPRGVNAGKRNRFTGDGPNEGGGDFRIEWMKGTWLHAYSRLNRITPEMVNCVV
jgi:hypothetical protein